MTTYDLYLESGPKRRKTMVHALDLLGCITVGPTTDAALAETPNAIRTFLRFLRRHGESVDPEAPFDLCVAEHVTEGAWLGNGSPYLEFAPDLEPVIEEEAERCLRRFRWMREELATWVAEQSAEQLAAPPAGGGRPAQRVLLHMLGAAIGGYLSGALGSAPGFHAVSGAAERGELPLPEALLQVADLLEARVRATTPAERAAVRERASGRRTLRKALRRTLEHDWEHLTELARRPGGPPL